MRTVAIINQKGGCGKTTTAINLSACLAQLKKRILLVDMDPQAHATLGLGFTPGEYPKSVYDLLIGNDNGCASPGDVILEITPCLHLLPSDVMLSTAEPILLQRDHREYYLSDVLTGIASQYDFIIIDCPPNIGMLTFNALFACSEVIIPIESGLFALHGLSKLLETIELVNIKRNRKIMVNALATMFDRRTRIAHESLDEMIRHMGGNVFSTLINQNVKLKEAAGHGQSIITYARDSSGYRDYASLAKELAGMKVGKLKKARQSRAKSPVVTDAGVLFSYYAPEAEKVYVVADFNEWKANHTPLQNIEGTGVWQKMVPLKKGRYEYKFFVDGQWITDPDNPNKASSEFGENSYIEIH
ncbi:MAG: AAA family ATPase [Deltaproteobacteria bacterium]|nr:AAA family ATPase [Deltaproteobacteria bacterium]